MSSLDRSSSGATRRALLAGLGMLPALALGGCFRPLYGSPAMGGAGAGEALRAVQIQPIEGRVGQQIRNRLMFGTTGGGEPAPPRYLLKARVGVQDTNAIVDIYTAEPQVDTVIVTVDFGLFPVGADKPVLTGRNFARKSYDRTPQRFQAVRAARDAENDASELVADEIRTRLAAFFAQQADGQPTPAPAAIQPDGPAPGSLPGE